MRWIRGILRAFGRPATAGHRGARSTDWSAPAEVRARDGAEEGGSALVAQAQRLAELQEERCQLERLAMLPVGGVDGGGLVAPAMPPLWHARMIEIECEIEQLREEMLAEEAERRSPQPRAAEEVGRRILDQIDDRGPSAEERELTYG